MIFCEYCGEEMNEWKPPYGSGYPQGRYIICPNDDCDYYCKTANHSIKEYGSLSACRNIIDTITGKKEPHVEMFGAQL